MSGFEYKKSPFCLDHCGDLGLLRRTLEDKGFVQPAIAEAIKISDSAVPLASSIDLPAVLRRTAESSPFHTLVRLFVLAQAEPEDAVRYALAPVELDQLLRLGLLRNSEDGIRAEASLIPFEGWFLVRDFWPEFTGRPCPHDYVLGVGPASLSVANLTVRKKVDSALDLGTGAGFQAALAASHTDRVLATDINPRALNFAALNARLNELTNIELRMGSMYEPVSECRFDLIVSNPPYVISPESQYQYRDGGMPGDAISEKAVRGAPELLREGGYCTIVFDWYHCDEEDWSVRPREWVSSSGCDAWIICSKTTDPIGYASTWLRSENRNDPERYARFLDDWLAYYESLGIGLISSGAMVLRRRSAKSNWIRAEKAPAGSPTGSCSDQIQRIFAAQDLLEELGEDRNLLGKSFRLTPDHQLEHALQAEEGNWSVKVAQLRQTRGFQFVGNVDRLVSTVLAGCDGKRTVGELVEDLAAGLGMDAEKIAPSCVGVIRKLLESGFLVATDFDVP